jgi:hypothetical protein
VVALKRDPENKQLICTAILDERRRNDEKEKKKNKSKKKRMRGGGKYADY